MTISRRSLLSGAAAAAAAAVGLSAQRPVRGAAIQLHPTLGDVSANLERVERLIRVAITQRADWIVLPEFFTSGLAYEFETLPRAPRPIDGEPMQMLKKLAREGGAAVGGRFSPGAGAMYSTRSSSRFRRERSSPTTRTSRRRAWRVGSMRAAKTTSS